MSNANSDKFIQPINKQQQDLVVQETHRCLLIAEEYYQRDFKPVPVLFDLHGYAAGMYRVKKGQREIRYNPYIFAKYFENNLKETIPHEVAHYVSDEIFGLNKIRPHGSEWKSVMQVFGANPKRTADYDLEGIPRRVYQQFRYACDCREYELTSRRHNKVQQGIRYYACRECGTKLQWLPRG